MHKLLFVSRFLRGGGAERVISVLAGALVEQGYEVGILSYIRTNRDYEVDPRVFRYSMGETYREDAGNAVSRTLYRRKQLKKIIQEYNPDLIIPFLEPIVREVYFASRGFSIPVVATVRNLHQYNSKLQKRIYDFIYEHCEMVCFQTDTQKQYFTSRTIEKSFVLPNPVDMSFISSGEKRGKKTGIVNIVTAGRLSKQKNHRLLVDAMALVYRTHPECVLRIYGEGEEENKLKEYLAFKEAYHYIKIMGRSENILKAYEDADLFVLSSDYEGMPNALAEAMAASLPCVSTDCPTGPRELLGENERGLLSGVGEAEKLAEAIIKLIEDPQLAYDYGKKAHEFVKKNLSPENIALRMIKECEEVLMRIQS